MRAIATTRRTFIKTTALSLPLLAAGCAQLFTRSGRAAEFVRVRNGRFELGGRPHFYVGTNLWFGCYVSDVTLTGGRQRLVRELDRLQALGVNNLRLLAGSETSALAGAIQNGITKAPHDYDENLLAGLDFCLAEMAKRNQRGVLFLSNYWQWSGSFAQYVRWATGETIPDPDRPVMAKGDWHAFMQFSAKFYQTPAAVELYRGYITSLLQRRNTVNGRIGFPHGCFGVWLSGVQESGQHTPLANVVQGTVSASSFEWSIGAGGEIDGWTTCYWFAIGY